MPVSLKLEEIEKLKGLMISPSVSNHQIAIELLKQQNDALYLEFYPELKILEVFEEADYAEDLKILIKKAKSNFIEGESKIQPAHWDEVCDNFFYLKTAKLRKIEGIFKFQEEHASVVLKLIGQSTILLQKYIRHASKLIDNYDYYSRNKKKKQKIKAWYFGVFKDVLLLPACPGKEIMDWAEESNKLIAELDPTYIPIIDQLMENAIAKGSPKDIAYAYQGQIRYLNNLCEDSKPYFEKSLAANPRQYGALIYTALLAEMDEKNYPIALETYKRIIQYYPRSATALNNLAYLLAFRMGNYEEALPYIEKAVQYRSVSNYIHTHGYILWKKKDPDIPTAIRKLRIASREVETAVYHLGEIYMEQENYEEAKKYYQKYVQENKEREHIAEAEQRLVEISQIEG